MKIRMTLEFNKLDRLALAHQHGSDKPWPRDEIEGWARATIDAILAEVIWEYEASVEAQTLED